MRLSLDGAIDTHVHTAPDVIPRAQDDFAFVHSAAAARLRAVVLKSHHFPTAARAQTAQKRFPQITVLGGLTLNAPSSGGLEADAVRACLAAGGRVIWLPTISAENHIQHVRRGVSSPHLERLTTSDAVVAVTDGGRAVAELDRVLDLIAASDAVLATGHIAPSEAVVVIDRAIALGVRRLVVTHPELPMISMPIETQKMLAARGVFFERCYHSILDGITPSDMLAEIRAVGTDTTILASDLGQIHNPPAVDGFRTYGELLMRNGLSAREWCDMTQRNPASLLGLRSVAAVNKTLGLVNGGMK